MSVWLGLALLGLASCVPPPNPYGGATSGSATLGSSGSSYGSSSPSASGSSSEWSSSGTKYHFSNTDPVDDTESRALTDYLHNNRLPLVGARVLAYKGTGPRKAILYGFVATPYGKRDALAKARHFLKDSGAEVDNRIMIKPELAGNESTPGSAAGTGSSSSAPNDIQAYEQQQRLAQQQQQQYMMNQGSSGGLMSLLPLLGLFGSFGGGSSGFSFGGGSYGGYGGYGGYPAYPMAPSYPPPGYYGSPYSPLYP